MEHEFFTWGNFFTWIGCSIGIIVSLGLNYEIAKLSTIAKRRRRKGPDRARGARR